MSRKGKAVAMTALWNSEATFQKVVCESIVCCCCSGWCRNGASVASWEGWHGWHTPGLGLGTSNGAKTQPCGGQSRVSLTLNPAKPVPSAIVTLVALKLARTNLNLPSNRNPTHLLLQHSCSSYALTVETVILIIRRSVSQYERHTSATT